MAKTKNTTATKKNVATSKPKTANEVRLERLATAKAEAAKNTPVVKAEVKKVVAASEPKPKKVTANAEVKKELPTPSESGKGFVIVDKRRGNKNYFNIETTRGGKRFVMTIHSRDAFVFETEKAAQEIIERLGHNIFVIEKF